MLSNELGNIVSTAPFWITTLPGAVLLPLNQQLELTVQVPAPGGPHGVIIGFVELYEPPVLFPTLRIVLPSMFPLVFGTVKCTCGPVPQPQGVLN